MEVVPAKKHELEEVLKLQYLAYTSDAESYADYSIPPLQQTIEGIAKEAKTSKLLVVKINGTIVGSVRGYLEYNVCKIGRLIVHPSISEKGLGLN